MLMALLSKEIYKYEFDFAGNWNKMTTSVAVVDSGRATFEPSEVTYRSIMYYLDENMVKMVQPPAAPATQPVAANNVARNTESKSPANSLPAPAKSGNQSAAPALPKAVDRVNGMNSAEVKATPGDNETETQQVVMETEPPSPTSRILKPVSGGVLNGTAISLPPPAYPDPAKRMRISGTVSVSVVVDETGKVISAEATGGPGPLREAAAQAAMRARFSPTKLSGQPVKVTGLINYKFSLAP